MTSEAGATASKARWRRLAELPLVVGIGVGIVGMLVRGFAFRPLPYPASFDWFVHFGAAWDLLHGPPGNSIDFRSPLYPLLLGVLGEKVGYLDAGVLIASVSRGGGAIASDLRPTGWLEVARVVGERCEKRELCTLRLWRREG